MNENFGEFKREYMKPNEKEKVLSLYDECKYELEEMLGITLSNIEGSGLRQITQEVIRSVAEDGANGMDQTGSYYVEIEDRFLREFYDVRLDELPIRKDGSLDEATKEYFREKQKEKHFP